MEIKYNIYQVFGQLIVGLTIFLFASSQQAFAASGTISVSPESGNFTTGQTVTVTMQINGGGESFNAAKANVSISSSLSIQSITLGDCGFSFVKTPTQTDPSFAGAILGGSSKSCTAYSLSVKPISAGMGTIVISDASILSAQGASQLLSSVKNANFTISGENISTPDTIPTEAPASVGGVSLYDIYYTFSYPKNIKGSGISFVLDPSLASKQVINPLLADGTAGATFTGVPQGAHEIVVLKDGKVLSRQIINVDGKNKKIALGVTMHQDSLLRFWPIFLAILILILLIILFKFRKHEQFRRIVFRDIT